MLRVLLALIFIQLSALTSATNLATGIVPEKCLQCLCNVESQCKNNPCFPGDGTVACGYFQITHNYWVECGSLGSGWEQCSRDILCSSMCVQNYMAKYISNCGGKTTCEQFVRLHHGGPQGCTLNTTLIHWYRVLMCMKRS